MAEIDEYEKRARAIVARGGQLLLAYDVGDCEVRFPSRRELVRLIVAEMNRVADEEKYGPAGVL